MMIDSRNDGYGVHYSTDLFDNLFLKIESCPDDGDGVSLQVSTMGGMRGVHCNKFLEL